MSRDEFSISMQPGELAILNSPAQMFVSRIKMNTNLPTKVWTLVRAGNDGFQAAPGLFTCGNALPPLHSTLLPSLLSPSSEKPLGWPNSVSTREAYRLLSLVLLPYGTFTTVLGQHSRHRLVQCSAWIALWVNLEPSTWKPHFHQDQTQGMESFWLQYSSLSLCPTKVHMTYYMVDKCHSLSCSLIEHKGMMTVEPAMPVRSLCIWKSATENKVWKIYESYSKNPCFDPLKASYDQDPKNFQTTETFDCN